MNSKSPTEKWIEDSVDELLSGFNGINLTKEFLTQQLSKILTKHYLKSEDTQKEKREKEAWTGINDFSSKVGQPDTIPVPPLSPKPEFPPNTYEKEDNLVPWILLLTSLIVIIYVIIIVIIVIK